MKKNEVGTHSVRVSPFEFELRHDPNMLTAAGGDAMFDQDNGYIVLNFTRAVQLLRDDILHEVLHAIIRQTPLFKNDEQWSEQEEKIVAAIAPRLLSFLQDNIGLVEWLCKESSPGNSAAGVAGTSEGSPRRSTKRTRSVKNGRVLTMGQLR